MSVHEMWAARFEAEGAAAYHNSTGGNPHKAGTMAHDRWAKGFMDARPSYTKGQAVIVSPTMTPMARHNGTILGRTKRGWRVRYDAWGMMITANVTERELRTA